MEMNLKMGCELPQEIIDAHGITEETEFNAWFVDGVLYVESCTDVDKEITDDEESDECDGDCENCEFQCPCCDGCMLEEFEGEEEAESENC